MNQQTSSGGIGVCGLLGVVFVALKLCGVINWSWLYVTLPFWGGLAFIAAAILAVAAGAAIYQIFVIVTRGRK